MAKANQSEKSESRNVAGERLMQFIERIERLNEAADDIKTDRNDLFTEVKGAGFDAKIVRKIVRLRKMDKAKRQEEQELTELYMSAIGEQ